MHCGCSPCLCEVFPRGSTFEAVSFRSLREPRMRVALCGGRGRRRRKKGVGGTINKLYCGRYVEQISAKRAGPVGYVYILTHLFSASSSYLYLFLRHVPSHHVRTTTATATFRPPTLHRRSMHVHHFFSFRPPRPILLLLPCPCTYIYFHCFIFFIFYHYNLCENALTDYMGQPIV